MRSLLGWLACASLATCVAAHAQGYGVSTRTKIEYAQHDGTKLAGGLYLPKGLDKAPLVIAAHGGGWQVGSPASYRYWGPFLAKSGYALFAISYRLSKPGAKTGPTAKPADASASAGAPPAQPASTAGPAAPAAQPASTVGPASPSDSVPLPDRKPQ